MEILVSSGKKEVKVQIEKAIGSLVFYSSLNFDYLKDEQIRIYVERNGHNNIEITKGFVSLKKLILCATYGADAITSFRRDLEQIQERTMETVCILELCEHGAIYLENNDKIKIELSNLNEKEIYVIDGIEEPLSSTEVFTYEEKVLSNESKTNDVNTFQYDIMVIDDSISITEMQYHFDNGHTCNYTRRELRAMSQDLDPVAYVATNGLVFCDYAGLIQLPLKGVNSITIKKTGTEIVNILMRHDEDLKTFRN